MKKISALMGKLSDRHNSLKLIGRLLMVLCTCLLLPAFGSYAAASGMYLDIDNDGMEEETEYVQERNVLSITKNGRPFIEADLYSYGVNFSGMGMFSSEYFFEYVKDATGRVYLHIYASEFVTDSDENGKRVSSAVDAYYAFADAELAAADVANYNWLYDRVTGESEMANITINGRPADSLNDIKTKYTAIENTRFDIPFP
jgi:hypothetical protein